MASYNTDGAGPDFREAVVSGDRKRTLEALRDHIAHRVAEGVAARDLAALSRQLRDITKELEALGVESDEHADELAERRAAVLSAAGVERAGAGGNARAARG